jgi:hypothetical protein
MSTSSDGVACVLVGVYTNGVLGLPGVDGLLYYK